MLFLPSRQVWLRGIDERGHGVVHVHVRQDQETFTFNYPRTLPGEKLNLRVGLAKKDRFNKKDMFFAVVAVKAILLPLKTVLR